jgi:hypothetical protein
LHIDIIKDNIKNEQKEFLKNFVIISIHDLHTREEKLFNFQQFTIMFSPKHEEIEHHKLTFGCISSKTTSAIKNDHELFSIFNKPYDSPFSGTDRLTCFFTFLFMGLLMEIIYYDMEPEGSNVVSNINSSSNSSIDSISYLSIESSSLTDGIADEVFSFEITPQTVKINAFYFKSFLTLIINTLLDIGCNYNKHNFNTTIYFIGWSF